VRRRPAALSDPGEGQQQRRDPAAERGDPGSVDPVANNGEPDIRQSEEDHRHGKDAKGHRGRERPAPGRVVRHPAANAWSQKQGNAPRGRQKPQVAPAL